VWQSGLPTCRPERSHIAAVAGIYDNCGGLVRREIRAKRSARSHKTGHCPRPAFTARHPRSTIVAMTDDVERHPIHFIRNLCADRSAAEVERAEDNFRAVLALLATEARERIAARRGQPDSTLWLPAQL